MRAMTEDFLQAYRFKVAFTGGPFAAGTSGEAEAAFNTVTVPEITLESVEYNEGMRNNRFKQPGLPTYSDLTLTRGVTKRDTAMAQWVKDVLDGVATFRSDITIKHYDRAGNIQRTYTVRNAYPIRVKLAADLDASSSEISIAEMDIAHEGIELGTDGDTKKVQFAEQA